MSEYLTYTAFARSLRPQAAGATEAAVQNAFAEAAREFYRRTRAWRERLTGVPITPGDNMIRLEPVDQRASVVFLERIVVEGSNVPVRGYMLSPFDCLLQSSVTGTVAILMSVQPRNDTDAVTVPAYARSHHYTGLEAGTLARLFRNSKAPYYDPAGAAKMEGRFESEIARAKSAVRTGYGQHPVQARIPVVSIR
jgi:hypothetical protein